MWASHSLDAHPFKEPGSWQVSASWTIKLGVSVYWPNLLLPSLGCAAMPYWSPEHWTGQTVLASCAMRTPAKRLWAPACRNMKGKAPRKAFCPCHAHRSLVSLCSELCMGCDWCVGATGVNGVVVWGLPSLCLHASPSFRSLLSCHFLRDPPCPSNQ